MSTLPQIRPGAPGDVETIVDFNARLARETEDRELDRATLAAGVGQALADPQKARYFVAILDERIVGQIMLTLEWSDWRNGNIWWIQSVYVHAEYRKNGVFRALFHHVESLARQQKAVGLRLYVEHQNHIAQQTYDRLGMHNAHYHVLEKMFQTS